MVLRRPRGGNPQPGDHLVCDVVGESIIITRTRAGDLAAYVNLCRHRGSQLTDATGKPSQTELGPTGTFKGSIQCPYHAWTYGFDGRLRAAPFLDESDGLEKEDLSLHHVAVETWAGFVWIHLDPEAAGPIGDQFQESETSLANYPLSDLRTRSGSSTRSRPTGRPSSRTTTSVITAVRSTPSSWSWCRHSGSGGGSELDWESGIPHREGAWTFTASGTTNRRPFPGLSPEEQERHKGQLVYPNLMLSLSADHVAAFTLWPHGPASTTVV